MTDIVEGPITVLDEAPVLYAEITRLRNELHIMEVWSARIIAGTQQDVIEIARLRAEIERLTAERDRQYDRNAEQVTRIAALGAENEKLRTALWDVHALANNGPLVWSKRIKATARAALTQETGDD